MNPRARLAAALAVAALSACTSSSAPAASAHLAEPLSLAVFRGVTTASGLDPTAVYPYRPYLAVANAAANDLSIIGGLDDKVVPSPSVVRGLVYPVPGRPVLVASADLGDRRPDLLVVVTAGDLPWLGGTQLRVIRTWAADGAVVDRSDGRPAVDFGADVLGLLVLPPDPAAPGSAKLVAALAGDRVATVTFSRVAGADRVDVDAAQGTVVSARVGFQPLALAAIPGERARVFAATTDAMNGVHGVAELDVSGVPAFVAALNAHAPTRLVAAGRFAEAIPFATDLLAPAFGPTPAAADRVLAVLDESGCGFGAPIPCGLVALDPGTRDLLPELEPALLGSMAGAFRAPIPLGYPTALAFSGPPAQPPSAAEPQFAGTFMRIATPSFTWQTTAVAGVATSDGLLTYVDVARWNVPSNQSVTQNVKATVSSTRPAGTSGPQYLTLVDPWNGATVAHTDATGLTTSVTVTAGWTPGDRWIVIREGALPGLISRRAQAFPDGALALQVATAGGVQEVVRVWDPTLGVTTGDVVVIEPAGLGTCTTFEASVVDLRPPQPDRPGGFVVLGHRTPTVGAWDRCVDEMRTTAGASYLATFRAGGYVLLRGATADVHVGRPALGQRFEVSWVDPGTGLNENALAARCTLPPAVPWQSGWSSAPPSCDPDCRAACDALIRARLARRVAYVNELPAGLAGPALAFTLALEAPTAAVPRDLALVIDTADGRAPFRVAPTAGYAVDPVGVVVLDRSPWVGSVGVRFLATYRGGDVLDSTPTRSGGDVVTIY